MLLLLLPMRSRNSNNSIANCIDYSFLVRQNIQLAMLLLLLWDLIGNNNNRIANCIFYITKKSNQPEDGS
jgi:hypothetical protein